MSSLLTELAASVSCCRLSGAVDEGKIDDLWASMMVLSTFLAVAECKRLQEESKPKPKPKPKPEAAATSLAAAAPAKTGTKRAVSDLDALMGLDSEPAKKKPGLDASAIARLKKMTQDPMAHKDNLVKIQVIYDCTPSEVQCVRGGGTVLGAVVQCEGWWHSVRGGGTV